VWGLIDWGVRGEPLCHLLFCSAVQTCPVKNKNLLCGQQGSEHNAGSFFGTSRLGALKAIFRVVESVRVDAAKWRCHQHTINTNVFFGEGSAQALILDGDCWGPKVTKPSQKWTAWGVCLTFDCSSLRLLLFLTSSLVSVSIPVWVSRSQPWFGP
jgi:hypothetical protein